MPSQTMNVTESEAAKSITACAVISSADELSDGPVLLTLPASAARVLTKILGDLGQAEGVRMSSELTVAQAASILNVPLKFVDRLIDEGQLRHSIADGERRLSPHDVLQFKRHLREQQDELLNELVAESQALGLY